MVRSLITQLSVQSSSTPQALQSLFSSKMNGEQQPMTSELLTTLRHIVQEFNETFIIIDALDECKEREELLADIERIVGWQTGKLHILATSRREKDIEETLEPLITEQMCIENALVDADIQTYLRETLQNDSKLKMWPSKVRKEIQETLMDGAHGM
jgi:hypothetical protein